MKTSQKLIGCLCAAVVILISVILIRTVLFVAPQAVVANPSPDLPIVQQDVAQHLSAAIQFKTVSYDDPAQRDEQTFQDFIQWLAQTYPLAHHHLSLEKVNNFSLLFRWQGQNAHQPGVLFSAHYDVVPVNPDTEQAWQHPPFAGVFDGEYIWGRGALDDKSAVIALMESVTVLLKQGFQPPHDIYLALTHDEEIGSTQGSAAITDLFKRRNTPLAWSLDEGSFVLKDLVPGIDKGIASINVAEKGYLTLQLTAVGQGGHSSMPPQDTAVSILANAIVKLNNSPIAGGLSGVSAAMYQKIAQHMSFAKRLLFANSWLFKPIIEQTLAATPSGNAMLRTTIAPTMLSGSIKANVLPTQAQAKINFRLHPRDKVADVIAHVKQAIDDARVEVEIVREFEASTVAPSSNQAFANITKAARQAHPGVIVTPGLTIAATDSRFYSKITDSYRFNPMTLSPTDFTGFHGTNERISLDNMLKAIHFYTTLMQMPEK